MSGALMAPRWRKIGLVVHVTTSVGWLGAVAAFLALAIAGLATNDQQVARGAYVALDLDTRFVLVPLALAALASGIVQAVGTPWGLARHYWVLIKLVITAAATVVLALQVAPIAALGAAAAHGPWVPADLLEERASVVVHSGGGLLVLLVPTVLSVYKPRALTPWGWRQQERQRGALAVGSQST